METLTKTETKRLDELEAVIERGKQTFIEVGLALTEIREQRLYKSEFKTFEEYCQKRWGWDRTYAHRVIKSSVAVTEMLSIDNKTEPSANGTPAPTPQPLLPVQNEGQARALAQVKDVETRQQVWQEANKIAADAGKPVTAKIVWRVRQIQLLKVSKSNERRKYNLFQKQVPANLPVKK